MSDEEGEPESILGLSAEAAADVVMAADDGRDRELVEETLGAFTEDDVVSESAIEEVQSNVSKLVATAEKRAEFAQYEIEEAREVVDRAPDLEVIDARLAQYPPQVHAVTERASELQPTFEREVTNNQGSTYELLQAIQQVANDAKDVQMTADKLTLGIESFERWVNSPDLRRQEVRKDAEALAETTEQLENAVETLDAEDESVPDVGFAWFDVTLQHRVVDLLRDDVRLEADQLHAWEVEVDDELSDEAREEFEAIDERLDDLAARHDELQTRIASVREREWIDRFETELAAFGDRLDSFEPPVDWGAVQHTLADFRPRADE